MDVEHLRQWDTTYGHRVRRLVDTLCHYALRQWYGFGDVGSLHGGGDLVSEPGYAI